MNDFQQSFVWVVTGGNFLTWSVTIFIIGAFFGWKQNKGMNGFKRSLFTLTPLSLIYFFSSANRVLEYTAEHGVGPQSFNNLISVTLITFFYLLGLLIGHNIKNEAINSAIKESGIPDHEKKSMILRIKEVI